MTIVTQEQVIERVKYILSVKTCLNEKDDGKYESEINLDYRDELGKANNIKIFKSDNPRETFQNMIFKWFHESESEIEENVIEIVKDNFDDVDNGFRYDNHEEFIRDWIGEHLYIKYPYYHYLRQDVYIDIIVNSGDGNYDYTMNNLFGSDYHEYDANSSVMWLLKQQGYTKRQITRFIKKEDFHGSRFLESIHTECMNSSSSMNALAFFVSMTLGEYFDLYSVVKSKSKSSRKKLILQKCTSCGLYDLWNGGGSVLDIELEKDVVLPLKFVDSAYPDGQRGYGIVSIYGYDYTFWKSDCLKIA